MVRNNIFHVLACFTALVVAATAAPSWWNGRQMATFYMQGGNPGACGQFHSDSEHLVALYTPVYAGGSNCGKGITVERNGKRVHGFVADECPTCEGPGHIDLSQGFFDAIASQEEGQVKIEWWFD
ncbi:hypothetical protein BDZ90DRAFT_225093 [Jaminaea rosea]|uniref:Barwin-like endoglucanase n=1 Tax=Jaminaea rosea TaxID=1569628 RepID=A0A316UZH8_9BASI|nr:hypothetical protein BDZ90DRAFT_225093 [Jaminaea rosea]PWN30168.1 hypothetical protein BDZ90DRAFT_225093 [Jaminaea rosea]